MERIIVALAVLVMMFATGLAANEGWKVCIQSPYTQHSYKIEKDMLLLTVYVNATLYNSCEKISAEVRRSKECKNCYDVYIARELAPPDAVCLQVIRKVESIDVNIPLDPTLREANIRIIKAGLLPDKPEAPKEWAVRIESPYKYKYRIDGNKMVLTLYVNAILRNSCEDIFTRVKRTGKCTNCYEVEVVRKTAPPNAVCLQVIRNVESIDVEIPLNPADRDVYVKVMRKVETGAPKEWNVIIKSPFKYNYRIEGNKLVLTLYAKATRTDSCETLVAKVFPRDCTNCYIVFVARKEAPPDAVCLQVVREYISTEVNIPLDPSEKKVSITVIEDYPVKLIEPIERMPVDRKPRVPLVCVELEGRMQKLLMEYEKCYADNCVKEKLARIHEKIAELREKYRKKCGMEPPVIKPQPEKLKVKIRSPFKYKYRIEGNKMLMTIYVNATLRNSCEDIFAEVIPLKCPNCYEIRLKRKRAAAVCAQAIKTVESVDVNVPLDHPWGQIYITVKSDGVEAGVPGAPVKKERVKQATDIEKGVKREEVLKKIRKIVPIDSIEEVNTFDRRNAPIYRIKGYKNGKILWILPARVPVVVEVSTDGKIIKVEKPWWSVLVFY